MSAETTGLPATADGGPAEYAPVPADTPTATTGDHPGSPVNLLDFLPAGEAAAQPDDAAKLAQANQLLADYTRQIAQARDNNRLGVPLGELWYLHELASWLREHNRSRFLLTAPPLRLPGIVGSPATPIATV